MKSLFTLLFLIIFLNPVLAQTNLSFDNKEEKKEGQNTFGISSSTLTQKLLLEKLVHFLKIPNKKPPSINFIPIPFATQKNSKVEQLPLFRKNGFLFKLIKNSCIK